MEVRFHFHSYEMGPWLSEFVEQIIVLNFNICGCFPLIELYAIDCWKWFWINIIEEWLLFWAEVLKAGSEVFRSYEEKNDLDYMTFSFLYHIFGLFFYSIKFLFLYNATLYVEVSPSYRCDIYVTQPCSFAEMSEDLNETFGSHCGCMKPQMKLTMEAEMAIGGWKVK